MDFNEGLSIPEDRQESFQIQGSWIPTTPGNPVPTRWTQTSAAEGEGSQMSRRNWIESLGFRPGLSQETPSANGATACLDSMACLSQSSRLSNWDSTTALAGSSSGSAGGVASQTHQALRNVSAGWNNIPYVNLVASVASSSSTANLQGSHNAASNPPFFPVYYYPSNYNVNQDRSLSSEFWNNSNCQSEPLNGLPVRHHNYDLNSAPKTMAECPSDRFASVRFAPVTPQKGQIIQDVTNSSAGERSDRKQEKQEVLTSPNGNEIIELDSGECSQPMRCTDEVTELQTEISHPQVGTSAAISTTLTENNLLEKAGNHGIDLNKTPQQKSRRKKHRPKVIVEGKPKRTPKPVTPNQNPAAKRKYVRKNSLKASETPSAEVVRKAIDPSPNSTAKPCRRALNFNLEDRREEHLYTSIDNQEFLHNSVGSPSSRWLLNLNSECQAQDLSSAIDGGSGTKSTVQLGQGVEVTVNNTPAGLAYDLNCSLNQVIKDYISLPETTDPAPQSGKRVPPTENSNCISKNRNEMEKPCSSLIDGENSHTLLNHQAQGKGISRIAFQTGAIVCNEKLMQPSLHCHSQSMSIGENDPNSNLCVPYVENEQARGSKREYSHTIDKTHAQAMNMRREIQQNSLQTYQEMLQGSSHHRNSNNLGLSFPEICKKRRTEKAQHTTPCSSSTAANRVGWGQEWQSYHGTADTKFNDMLSTKGPRNRNSKSVPDVYAHSAQTKSFPVQDSTIDPLSLSRTNFAGLQSSGFMLNFGLTEKMTKKRSKAPTRVRDLASLIAIPQCTQMPSTPLKTAPKSGDRQGTEIVHRPQAGLEAFVAENIAKKKRTRKGTPATLRGRSQVTQTNIVSIDVIVHRLKHLDINRETNRIPDPDQNALVPYNGNGTMVPYEGLFDPTRRRRPRPKVDLDPETDRVWKLLMGKPAIEGMEQTNKKTEKWWEEERRVFQGRADSFIARMHLVQGDRRFSQWKGSVVDSVVGVFLTQNVSDHLSSSAFMSLAARFPLREKTNEQGCFKEGTTTSLEDLELCVLDTEDTIKWHENMPSQLVCDQSSMTSHETGHIEEQEVANSNESFGSNLGDGSTDNSRSKELPVCSSSPGMSHDLVPNITGSLSKNIGMVNFIQEDRKANEDAVSSQNSIESFTFQIIERNGSCSDSNSEAEDLVTQSPSKSSSDGLDGCTFTDGLQMGRNPMFPEFYNCGNVSSSFNQSPNSKENQSKAMDSDKHRSSSVRIGCLKDSSAYMFPPNSLLPHKQVPIHSSTYSLHVIRNSELLEVQHPETLGEVSRSPLPLSASEITKTKHANSTSLQDELVQECASATTVQKAASSAQEQPPADLCESLNKHQTQTLYGLQPETYSERNPKSFNHQQRDRMEPFRSENNIVGEPTNPVCELAGRQDSGMQQVSSSLNVSEVLDAEKGRLADQEKCRENKLIQSDLKKQVYVSDYSATGSTKNLKAKKEAGKKKEFDWDSLRKHALENSGKKERSNNTMDSLDWEAVRSANVNEIANAIRERGMNNMLAERIQDFLNRIVREHGSIDLEWLRDVPPDQVKEYLLSIRGLGLKSVECVRLLTLHHLAFPVDTNVGRIAVRLGWVPLQPLPESLQLHLLEMYPVLESIQKYLWPRLCKLDQRTLYELHYQMITFGKVFCTKSKPNCNSCPMRGECKHFASAFASARFALPAPEEKSVVCSTAPLVSEHNQTLGINNQTVGINTMPLLLPAANPLDAAPENKQDEKSCEPIIEVPATPEPECTEISQSDIEDILDDPDEIPTIKLNIEEFTMNLQNYMNEYSMELQEGNMSQALVALTPEAASIPVPKLKNVSRLRTEHQVYELPDSHPLLKGLDKREPDDPCSYLLAIWTPGETAESIQPPKSSCGAQETGKLCNEKTCFSCNSIREANSQTVRGTLLIPCRTAMRGSFPLNGTYFQVNEVFADHDSSVNPIDVPRSWLWNLSRRTVYFGTSIPTIFKGLTTEGIQHCFWRGFVCVRGFDQKSRAPRPLMARLHFPASKLARTKT